MPNNPNLTPINTPPHNYDDTNIHGFTPPSNGSGSGSTQYSDEYNDYWNRMMTNPNVIHNPGQINEDDFIQGRALNMNDLDGESSTIGDFDHLGDTDSDSQEQAYYYENKDEEKWAEGEMPPTPTYPKQIIDVNTEGYDPFMMENVNISNYLNEDKKDNVAILYNSKVYLTSRAIIDQQENDALVYECLEGDKKRRRNVVGNLPLYNIKKIGLDLTSDNAVGVEAEYIYMDGIDELLTSEDDWQYYSIIPLPDKQLVSVISVNEAGKIGTGIGSGVSALHCQAGQGGLAGILVKAYPNNVSGGKKSRSVKRRRQKKTVKKGVGKAKKRQGKTAYKKRKNNLSRNKKTN